VRDIQELQQAVASVHQRGRGVERVMGPEDGRLERNTGIRISNNAVMQRRN
jgi:hypothetical protein